MNKHVWRFRWKVSEVDLAESDLWTESAIRRAAIAGVNPGVFGKSKLTASAGLVVNVPDVDIVDALGRILDITSTTADLSTDEGSVSTDPPGGQTRWVVVAIEFAVDSTNPQTDPVLGTTFDFHNLDSYTVRVVAGAATAGTPVPPNVGNGIIVGGVILTSGQSTISQGNLDDGENALIHTDKVMRRGALERIDTVYLDADLGTLTAVVDLQELLEIISTKIGEKTDKVVPTAPGNFAGLDASGNLTDTTIAPADKADTSALTAHTTDSDNPHGVNRVDLDVYSKAETDTLVDASLVPPEAYDPTPTGNYPLTFNGGTILGGHAFRITAAGSIGIGSKKVNVEDLLIALQDSPFHTNDAHWMIAESNRDQATESVKGVAKVASQATTDTGTNDTDFLTALKMRTSVATESRPGVVEQATQAEVDGETDNSRYITALRLASSALATAVGLNTAKVTNANHTGDVSGSGVLTIGAGVVDESNVTGDVVTWKAGEDITWTHAGGLGSGDIHKIGRRGNITNEGLAYAPPATHSDFKFYEDSVSGLFTIRVPHSSGSPVDSARKFQLIVTMLSSHYFKVDDFGSESGWEIIYIDDTGVDHAGGASAFHFTILRVEQ